MATRHTAYLPVKINDALQVIGGKALYLCDKDGNPLPGQIECTVRTGIDDVPIATVKLFVRLD